MLLSQPIVLLCMLFIANYGTLAEADSDANTAKKPTDDKLHEDEEHHSTKESGDDLKEDNDPKVNTEMEEKGEEDKDLDKEMKQQGSTVVQSKTDKSPPKKIEITPVFKKPPVDKQIEASQPAEKTSGASKNTEEKPEDKINTNKVSLEEKTGVKASNSDKKPEKKTGIVGKVTSKLPSFSKTPKPSENTNLQSSANGKKASEPPRANDELQSTSGLSKDDKNAGMLLKIKRNLSRKPSDNNHENEPTQDTVATTDKSKQEKKPGMIKRIASSLPGSNMFTKKEPSKKQQQTR